MWENSWFVLFIIIRHVCLFGLLTLSIQRYMNIRFICEEIAWSATSVAMRNCKDQTNYRYIGHRSYYLTSMRHNGNFLVVFSHSLFCFTFHSWRDKCCVYFAHQISFRPIESWLVFDINEIFEIHLNFFLFFYLPFCFILLSSFLF